MIRLLLIAEGARFAGIEGHLMTLLRALPADAVAPQLAVFNRGPLAECAATLGVPVHFIERKAKYDPGAIRRVAQLVAETGTGIVHTHGYLANVIAARALAGGRVPLVTTVHGAPEPFGGWAGLKMKINLALDRRAMKQACRRVIVVATYLAETLARQGVPAEKIKVIYNGLPPWSVESSLRYQSRGQLDLAPDALAVAFVGRLEPVKDPLAFVEFAHLLHDYHPNTTFLVAGDGPLQEAMCRRVQELGLLPHVRFLGFVDDMDSLMAAADLLVLTSRHEGIPFAALEAMRAGVPVVAPAVGGLPELLGGLDGLLSPAHDVRQLAALAVRLLGDRQRLAQAGKEVTARFDERFTAGGMVDKLLGVYREILAEVS